MFTGAVAQIGRCLCTFRDPTDADDSMVGQGCMIAADLVLTALHVAEEVLKGGAIIVDCPTGRWLAELVWSHAATDLAVVKLTVQRNGDQGFPVHATFPTISTTPLALGTQIGYLAVLRTVLKKGDPPFISSCLFASFVARQEPLGSHSFFLTTPSYCTRSFSGAPVFDYDGQLRGVLLGVDHIVAEQPSQIGSRHPDIFDFLFPRISALATHLVDLEKLLTPSGG